MTITLLLLLVAAVVVAALAFVCGAGASRRERAVRELLDAADALEARLRTARAEIEAVAGDEATTRSATPCARCSASGCGCATTAATAIAGATGRGAQPRSTPPATGSTSNSSLIERARAPLA